MKVERLALSVGRLSLAMPFAVHGSNAFQKEMKAPQERARSRRGNEADRPVTNKIRLVASAATMFLVPMRSRRTAGFTLLEVILAIVIAVGLLVVALFFYRQAADFRAQLLTETERISTARLLMDKITAELRTARGHAVFPKSFIGGSNFVQFIKTDVPSRSDWSGGALGRVASPVTDLKWVRYQLASLSETNVGGRLGRAEEPLVAKRSPGVSSVSVDNNVSAQPALLPITDVIQLLAFRFWNGSAWQESWDAANLPQGVEITLSTEPPSPETETQNSHAEVFRRIIYLPGSSASEAPLLSSNLFARATSPAKEVR